MTCGDCGKKLRSSWAKGKYKHYAYYLCQTKGCDSYGKSIPRARIEDAFGDVVRTLQPTPGLLQLAEMMFRDAWAARLDQMKDASKSVRRQIAEADKQIESLLDRIMSATNDAVISAYEQKIGLLEKDKTRLHDTLIHQAPAPKRFDEALELSLRFLSSPWKIWESGNILLRRTLLRLAFTEGFSYHRTEGARTPKTTLPFKVLGAVLGVENKDGAAGEN